MSHRSRSRVLIAFSVASLVSVMAASFGGPLRAAVARGAEPPRLSEGAAGAQPAQPSEVLGATTTRLPDGRWLVVGGQSAGGAVANARVIDPRTHLETALAGLQIARSGHTATLLPDGTVLVAGGRGRGGDLLSAPEIFDPSSNTFAPIAVQGAQPRMDHTATVLTDGRLLIAGGSGPDGALGDAEIWVVAQGTATRAAGSMTQARARHDAELLADGRVRLTRGTGAGADADEEIFDPQTGVFTPAPRQQEDQSAPRLVFSMPESGAADVPLDVRLSLRFSQPVHPDSVNAGTIVMSGPDGPIDVTLVSAEQGRLAFVSPRLALKPGTEYVVTIDGAVDRRGVSLPMTSVVLTTRDGERPNGIPDQEAWAPDGGRWRSDRADSPWQSLKPLQAPPGTTALAGQVLRLDGMPLANVTLTMEGRSARTDRTGRFLLALEGVTTGEHTFAIDGRSANRPHRTYGFYEVRWKIQAGRTNVLPFTIWSPLIDTAHQVTIPVPTTGETVITTPTMPGLELHLPAGTTIVGEDHKEVRTVSLTPIPLDRTPFPLPGDATFTMFFTIQPGGAYLRTTGAVKGGWLVYPRRSDHPVGAKLPFFNYDPDDKGWFVYGLGTVTATQVVPDPKTRLYGFTGASFNSGPQPPAGGATPGGGRDGDPVDPSTGAFIMEKTDLYLPDVMPLALTRTYNSLDNNPSNARPLGIGMMHNYGLYQWSGHQFEDGDLILPDGGRIHFTRISDPSGTWDSTVMEAQQTPTAFYKARLRFDGNAWEIALKDGTVYILGHVGQLQRIRDRYGNETRLTWSETNIFGAGVGNLLRITSPNGRWIAFTYDTNSPVNRITDATDNIGRNVHYTYDANGHLSTVTDPESHVTTYTWDANHRMTSIKDGRNIVYLTNHYDANGRVDKQTLADPTALYSFAYTADGGGNITRAEVTNPRGYTKQLNYSPTHYLASQVEALGQPEERLTTINRLVGSNLVTAVVDALVVDGSLRKTEYTYDDFGHVQSIKRLANTSNPVITSFTYEPTFFQLATVTDPMLHTWTIQYDGQGKLLGSTDPLSHQTSTTMNTQGQVTSVTDALQHSWQFVYAGGDMRSITNPLGATSTRFVDGAGRVLTVTNPLGRVTHTTFDKLNDVSQLTDALGGQTVLQRDPNGRVLSLSDALTHSTIYTFDDSDRVATRTDALQRTARYGYDRNDNVIQHVNRAGQVTNYQYDSLDRLTQAIYADGSTIQYFYDVGDRLWKVMDSVAGTITREYDGLDRLTNETTPEGSVSYTYNAAGRRESMTVLGQLAVTYDYDNAHRLLSITQDTATVSMTYDNADRRSTLTLPNGVVTTYGYDDANQITSLTYTFGSTTLGSLTYTYDAAGNRMSVGGTWAATGLPQPLLSATYDAGNQIATWAGRAFDYDANGSLVSDGLTSYGWNARSELSSLSGGTAASFGYDGMERRRLKTTSSGTSYIFDGVSVTQERVGGAQAATILSGGVDEVFQRTDIDGTRGILTDGMGSVIALTDASGVARTRYTYEPFGSTSTSGVTSTNPTQYTGRDNDSTGLYYYRARYYDPRLQRFISEDPSGFAAGDVNLHRYVRNNPTGYRDPSGRFAILLLPLAGCLGGAAGAAIGNEISGRKTSLSDLAAGCAAGSIIGLGAWAVGPAIGEGAFAGAGGGGAAAAGAAAAARGAAAAQAARQPAQNLSQQLAIEETLSGLGERIMQGEIKDPLFPENLFEKWQHVHRGLDGSQTTVHGWRDILTGEIIGAKIVSSTGPR